MALIALPQRFLTQPQSFAPVNPEWIKRGLVIVCNPAIGAYNQVTRQLVTNSGNMVTTPTQEGISWQGASSKYIDFGAGYNPGSAGATIIQTLNPGSTVNTFPVANRTSFSNSGFDILCGGVAAASGNMSLRVENNIQSGDMSGLNDGTIHTIAARITPSVELKIWADRGNNSAANTSSIPASVGSTQNLRLHARLTTYYPGKSGIFLYFDRPLPDSDVGTLLSNPYLVYSAPPRRIWLAAPAPGGAPITVFVNHYRNQGMM